MFTQYRDNAPSWIKRLVANALDMLLPQRLVRHDGPSTVSIQLLQQVEKGRICAHILSYIPVRKSATIDIIEDRTSVHNLTLQFDLPCSFKKARIVPEDIVLDIKDSAVTIPEVKGYTILELS
jgi:hypothetical protein